jgi:hypothetical protein
MRTKNKAPRLIAGALDCSVCSRGLLAPVADEAQQEQE